MAKTYVSLVGTICLKMGVEPTAEMLCMWGIY